MKVWKSLVFGIFLILLLTVVSVNAQENFLPIEEHPFFREANALENLFSVAVAFPARVEQGKEIRISVDETALVNCNNARLELIVYKPSGQSSGAITFTKGKMNAGDFIAKSFYYTVPLNAPTGTWKAESGLRCLDNNQDISQAKDSKSFFEVASSATTTCIENFVGEPFCSDASNEVLRYKTKCIDGQFAGNNPISISTCSSTQVCKSGQCILKQEVGAKCGNGICELGESRDSCSADCGTWDTGGGGGGGGASCEKQTSSCLDSNTIQFCRDDGVLFNEDCSSGLECKPINDKNVDCVKIGEGKASSVATQVSLTEKDIEKATAATIVQSTCKVTDNCLPYKPITDTKTEFSVSCKKTALIEQKINEAVDKECSALNFRFIKGALGVDIASCAAGLALGVPTGGTSILVGCLYVPLATIGVSGGVLAFEAGCEISKVPGDSGICVASPKDEGFDFASLPHFKLTGDDQTDVLIQYLGGLFILILLFRSK